jgi:hypothetical protein
MKTCRDPIRRQSKFGGRLMVAISRSALAMCWGSSFLQALVRGQQRQRIVAACGIARFRPNEGKRTGKPSCTTNPDATYAVATLQSHLPAA